MYFAKILRANLPWMFSFYPRNRVGGGTTISDGSLVYYFNALEKIVSAVTVNNQAINYCIEIHIINAHCSKLAREGVKNLVKWVVEYF